MDLVKLVAVGLGLAVYAGGSIFARRLRRRKKAREKDQVASPAHEEPKARETASVEPIETVKPVERHAADDRTVQQPVEKDVLSTVKTEEAKVKERPAVKRKAPSQARPSPPSTPSKEWFLLRSKTGSVRVVQAKRKTPKTVAGPFETKEEAYRARALELARASVSPKRTERRPKGKSSRA